MQTTIANQADTRKVQNPLVELREWLAESLTHCRAQRWLRAAFRIDVAQDILADVEKNEQTAKAVVYGEEQRNLLNAQELDEIRADGVVTADELIRLGKLASRERRSAAVLHGVTEVLA